jgi:DNA-binding HxlR family transcriptional regulator/DNA-binding XRE family transcriptional regulator
MRKRTRKQKPFGDSFALALGILFAQRRQELGLSQADIEHSSGIHRSYLSGVENGARNISIKNLYELAGVLGLDVPKLIREAEKNQARLARQRKKQRALAQLEKEKVERRKKRQEREQREQHEYKVTPFPETRFSVRPDDAEMIESAIQLLGSKWTSAIFIELAEGKKRTTELLYRLPGISPKTATFLLRKLQKAGFVTRRSFSEVPPRVEYSLTSQGQESLILLERVRKVFSKPDVY